MKKNTILISAAFAIASLVALAQTAPYTTMLAVYKTNSIIVNVPDFFEANKAKLNAAVSNRPSLNVNGLGPVSNIVDSPTTTWTVVNGQAQATSSGSSGSGLLVCSDDSTVHAIGVFKMGTNYLLSLVLTTNAPSPSTPASIPLMAGDLSIHQMIVTKIGTNYLLGLSQ